jgi:hypothetical protein
MKYITLALLLATASGVYAQLPGDSTKATISNGFINKNLNYKLVIKLYNTTLIQTRPALLDIYSNYKSNTYVWLQPTISLQWKTKNKQFNEIELSAFNASKKNTFIPSINYSNYYNAFTETCIITEKKSSLAIKYEYIFSLNTNQNYKLVPSLGAGLHMFYSNVKKSSTESKIYDRSNHLLGATFYLAPRLSYFLTSKLLLDFNIPIYLTEFNVNTLHYKQSTSYTTTLNNSSSMNYYNKTNQIFNFEAFPNLFSFRLGIGIKI